MPATAHRHQQVMFTREIHAGDDITRIDALGDQTGMLVDTRVVDLARLVVVRIARLHDQTAQLGGQRLDRRGFDCRGNYCCRHCMTPSWLETPIASSCAHESAIPVGERPAY